jgi:hypothetical protein
MFSRSQALSYQSRGSKLDSVTLAIVKGQTKALKTFVPCYRETRGRINAATEEANRSSGRSVFQCLQYRFGSRLAPWPLQNVFETVASSSPRCNRMRSSSPADVSAEDRRMCF